MDVWFYVALKLIEMESGDYNLDNLIDFIEFERSRKRKLVYYKITSCLTKITFYLVDNVFKKTLKHHFVYVRSAFFQSPIII